MKEIDWPGPWLAPHPPSAKQRQFLKDERFEVLYGGSVGGGKTDALLMAGLQYVHVPRYAGIIFRKRHVDLYVPDGLVQRSSEWLTGAASWNDNLKVWTFPNDATLSFGYMDGPDDHLNHQGAAYQFIGWDELTHFRETQYRYMMSRCRRTVDIPVPLRVRASSNPGGRGHQWVRQRFFIETAKDRGFIAAKLADNPGFAGLAGDEYRQSLSHLTEAVRKQLLDGNWDVVQAGPAFDRTDFKLVRGFKAEPSSLFTVVRYWDFAATPLNEETLNDPDWTVGTKMAEKDGKYWVLDVQRVRESPGGVQALMQKTAEADGPTVLQAFEQEPGSAGVMVASQITTSWLPGGMSIARKATGSKVERCKPYAVAVEGGNVSICEGPWNEAFLEEHHTFPLGGHDDCVDSASGAFLEVTQRKAKFRLPAEPITPRRSFTGGETWRDARRPSRRR